MYTKRKTINPLTLVLNNPTEQEKLYAVQKNGMLLEFIDNPSNKVIIAAILQNPLALRLIDKPTEEMKIAAIESNVEMYNFIKIHHII